MRRKLTAAALVERGGFVEEVGRVTRWRWNGVVCRGGGGKGGQNRRGPKLPRAPTPFLFLVFFEYFSNWREICTVC